MPSTLSILVISYAIIFVGGSLLGALMLFIVSIHRTRRTSLFEVSGQRRRKVSRCVLVTTRTSGKEHSK